MPRTSASARKPSRAGVLGRRKQQPQSLPSKVGHNAMAGLLGAGGAAGRNKSKVALLAGLGAAGAAVMKKRRGGESTADGAPETASTTTIVDDPHATVPVAPAASDGAGSSESVK